MTTPPQRRNEWAKLSPAISHKVANADELLSARRQETQEKDKTSNPSNTGTVHSGTTPWASQKQPSPVLHTSTTPESHNQQEQHTAPTTSAAEETATTPEQPLATQEEQHSTRRAARAEENPEQQQKRLSTRETAVEDKPKLLGLRATLIGLSVPLLTFFLSLKLVASSTFLWIEYHRAAFPKDRYGFDTQDRLTYGNYGLDYIFNLAPASYLSSIKNLEGKKLFLDSEVQHMTDVKHLMLTLTVLAIMSIISALLCARTLSLRAPGIIRRSIWYGNLATALILAVLAIIAITGWDVFFTQFHHIFFPQGNWQFRESDTLIRLYPPQFWVDAALVFCTLCLSTIAVLAAITWPTTYRKIQEEKRKQERQELRQKLAG
ncbi:TIGR01906 family membrane protein [Rothia sp. P13129]|uniref:TIGR01906 family membrane protein n=1 Tax=Rothia sp. P13129 TaxID=3402664 RepID=UPI003AD4B826